MPIRVRLNITWTVNPQDKGPFSGIEDFTLHAQRVLKDAFAHYNAELAIVAIDEINPAMADIKMAWDVNLDMVPGSLHEPEDHEAHVQHNLRDAIKFFTYCVKVDEILRHADFDEAIDHAEIVGHYEGDTTKDDYPVFRPETHPDWPEAQTVFLQDGAWFWTDGKRGPAVGPDPEKIFTPWDPDFRARRCARHKRETDLAELRQG